MNFRRDKVYILFLVRKFRNYDFLRRKDKNTNIEWTNISLFWTNYFRYILENSVLPQL